MLTAVVFVSLIVTAVAGAELVRIQCRRMLSSPHKPAQRKPAQRKPAGPTVQPAEAG